MCLGESATDRLAPLEQSVLRERAAATFPDHAFTVRSNADGVVWVVLAPQEAGPAALRFTICRLDGCVMVLAEDSDKRRQFCTAATVEDAIGFARLVTDQAILAAMNAHGAPATLQ